MQVRRLKNKLNQLWIIQSTLIGLLLLPIPIIASTAPNTTQTPAIAMIIMILILMPAYHYAVVWGTSYIMATYYPRQVIEIEGTRFFNPRDMFTFGALTLLMDIVGIIFIILALAIAQRPGPYKYDREWLIERFEAEYGIPYYEYYQRYGDLPPDYRSLLR